MRGFLEGYVYQYCKNPKAESKSESKSKTNAKPGTVELLALNLCTFEELLEIEWCGMTMVMRDELGIWNLGDSN